MSARGFVLACGSLDPVVAGDVVDEFAQPAPERFGGVAGGEFGDLVVLTEQSGTLDLVEAAGRSSDCVGVFDPDSTSTECVVEPGRAAECVGSTFGFLSRPSRAVALVYEYVGCRRSIARCVEFGKAAGDRSFELISASTDRRDVVQRIDSSGSRHRRDVQPFQALQTVPRRHLFRISVLRSKTQ